MEEAHTGSSTATSSAAGSDPLAADGVRTPAEGPVDRAFHVLQVVVAAREPIGVREIGRRSGLPRSTASRLVGTLDRLRMVIRTADGMVAPGPALATLQTGDAVTPMLRDRLRPLLVDLVQTFGEHAALAVDDGDAVLYIAQAASEQPVSVNDVTGERHPFHLVAPGLIAMARWSHERLDRYLDAGVMPATSHSVTDSDRIRERLAGIAERGFVWTDQELELGVNGLAIPVPGDGQPTATISLYGPSYRFAPELRPDLAAELVAFVNRRLGV